MKWSVYAILPSILVVVLTFCFWPHRRRDSYIYNAVGKWEALQCGSPTFRVAGWQYVAQSAGPVAVLKVVGSTTLQPQRNPTACVGAFVMEEAIQEWLKA